MLEGVLVGLIVAAAALHVARRFLPRRGFGMRGAPATKAGCDTGCGSCGGCGAGSTASGSSTKPLTRG
jgi:hypothetical protein